MNSTRYKDMFAHNIFITHIEKEHSFPIEEKIQHWLKLDNKKKNIKIFKIW